MPGTADEQRVKEIIAGVYARSQPGEELRWDQIDSDFPLYGLEEAEESLGLDSLDAVEIATELEEEFDVVLPTELNPLDFRTVRQVIDLLNRTVAEQHGTSS